MTAFQASGGFKDKTGIAENLTNCSASWLGEGLSSPLSVRPAWLFDLNAHHRFGSRQSNIGDQISATFLAALLSLTDEGQSQTTLLPSTIAVFSYRVHCASTTISHRGLVIVAFDLNHAGFGTDRWVRKNPSARYTEQILS